MKNLVIYERAKIEANYIIEHNATVRTTAIACGVCKSTVHKDITKVLEENHDPLAAQCRKILTKNYNERCIRGGLARAQKYAK